MPRPRGTRRRSRRRHPPSSPSEARAGRSGPRPARPPWPPTSGAALRRAAPACFASSAWWSYLTRTVLDPQRLHQEIEITVFEASLDHAHLDPRRRARRIVGTRPRDDDPVALREDAHLDRARETALERVGAGRCRRDDRPDG